MARVNMTHQTDSDLPTITLLSAAVATIHVWKDVGIILSRRPPDQAGAEYLIAKYEDGSCPPWRAANLLGCIGHEIGYDTALRILLDAPGQDAESYAGVAMVRIDPHRATKDLTNLLATAEQRRSRAGAAWGLASVPGSSEVIQSLFRAALERRAPFSPVASALEKGSRESVEVLECVVQVLTTPLKADDAKRRRLLIEVARNAVSFARQKQEPTALMKRIRSQVQEILVDSEHRVGKKEREDLEEWFAPGPGK